MQSSALLERLSREGGDEAANTPVLKAQPIQLAPKIAAVSAQKLKDREKATAILLNLRLMLDASIPDN